MITTEAIASVQWLFDKAIRENAGAGAACEVTVSPGLGPAMADDARRHLVVIGAVSPSTAAGSTAAPALARCSSSVRRKPLSSARGIGRAAVRGSAFAASDKVPGAAPARSSSAGR